MEHSSQPYEKLGEPLYGTCFQNMIGTRWGLNNSWLYTTDKDMPSLAALSHMCNYSQSPSGRMCQKRHVFEMFEITYFHPFRDLDIVLGRRDYHHSIRREILPRIGKLTFLLVQMLNFSIFGPN